MTNLMSLPVGTYHGTLAGPEAGDGWARVEVRRLTENALSVDYEAYGADGLQHVEHTVISAAGLYVVASELPTPVMFECQADGRYVAAMEPPMEIRPEWDGELLQWAWIWAPTGEQPREQSRARMRPDGASLKPSTTRTHAADPAPGP